MLYHSPLPLLAVLVPAMAAAVEYAVGKIMRRYYGSAGIAGAAGTLVVASLMEREVLRGSILVCGGGQFYVDGLNALVVLLIGAVSLAVAVYSPRFLWRALENGCIRETKLPLYHCLFMFFICSMIWACVTANIIMLFVTVEATTLASGLLVTFYWRRESLEAGYKYLILCTVGITFALFGCVLLYAVAANKVGGIAGMLIPEIAALAGSYPPNIALLAVAFFLVGFGTKAGVVPFHAWVPDAYSQSPTPVSALLSGLSGKVAAYALTRVVTMFYPEYNTITVFVVILGLFTMVTGACMAFAQDDLKRMLAYSSISQIGYIIMGLGIGTYLGFFGGLYHLVNHALLKVSLFLCVGLLVSQYGTSSIQKLRRIRNKNPFVTVCFFTAAFSVAGLPPLSGFWSKITILIAAGQAGLWWAVGIAIFTSLLTLAYMVRAGYMVFMVREAEPHEAEPDTLTADLTRPYKVPDAGEVALPGLSDSVMAHMESGEWKEEPVPAPMWAALAAVTALSLLVGIVPQSIYGIIHQAGGAVLKLMAGG